MPASASPPQRERAFAIVVAQRFGDHQKRAKDDCPVVAGQLDEPRLNDETAEFD